MDCTNSKGSFYPTFDVSHIGIYLRVPFISAVGMKRTVSMNSLSCDSSDLL